MSFGLQVTNNNNNLIINGEAPGPYCVYARYDVGFYHSNGNWKYGYLVVPHNSMVFFPFDGNHSGGVVDYGETALSPGELGVSVPAGHQLVNFLIYTGWGHTPVLVARPSVDCEWGRGGQYGLRVFGSGGQLVYDGGQPIIQTTHAMTYLPWEFMVYDAGQNIMTHSPIWQELDGANWAMQMPAISRGQINHAALTYAGQNGMRPTPLPNLVYGQARDYDMPGTAIFAKVTI